MNENTQVGITAGIFAFLGVIFLATLAGTLIYWLWPIAIPAVFPGLITSGILASSLSWKASVALSWICTLLLKSSTTVNHS